MLVRREAPLHIAFIWNMHQPFYQDPASTEYQLPWVRMHAVKDYYGMAHILRRFPQIRQTFNLVPSLLKQINDYVGQGLRQVKEKHLQISLKPAAELDEQEKIFLLANGFMCNRQRMIYPYPRYAQLLAKRGEEVCQESLRKIQGYFSTQEYLDLQVWMNLCWIDPFFCQDPRIKQLLARGENFREQDKELLLEVQEEIMAAVIPEYRDLARSGQVELCTSALYHPILPLLCDSRHALEALPELALPDPPFKHPEDAAAQLEKGRALFEQIMGFAPRGLWPSEGSVCQETIPLMADAGFCWIASDEQILGRSLDVFLERDERGLLRNPSLLYQPYLVEQEGRRLAVIFRDQQLSDKIGFDYSQRDSREAAGEFLQRLRDIQASLPAAGDYLVSIILDGENAWEYFPNNGRDFLCYLYEGLSNEPLLETVTVSEYLAACPPRESLGRLFAGSWINHNFKIWIGDEEDNSAWRQISQAREALVEYERNHPEADRRLLESAWEQIYIAEGSDWFWWYGSEHSSAQDDVFDSLFRRQLINIYNMLGLEVPENMHLPNLSRAKVCRPQVPAKGFINPVLDGRTTNYYEWLEAGCFDLSQHHGGIYQTMHHKEKLITALHYGFNREYLFLKVDFAREWLEEEKQWTFFLNFIQPAGRRVKLEVAADKKIAVSLHVQRRINDWRKHPAPRLKAVLVETLELQLPLALFGLQSDEELQMTLVVERGGLELERWPNKGCFALVVPGEDFEADMWQA